MRAFITSTGTGTGKTYTNIGFANTYRASNSEKRQSTHAALISYKPLITGFDPADAANSDTGLILQALGLPLTEDNIARLSPWRFKATLAPSMAARLEGRSIDFDALVAHSREILNGPEQHVFIEGIGGVMVPLTDRHTVADWIAALNIPAILVTGTYLGSLSHALTALEVMKYRNIPLHTLIVNQSLTDDVGLTETADELSRWTTARIITIPRRADGDRGEGAELKGIL